MEQPNYLPKIYLYRRIVQAKLYIDRNYAEALNLNNIADQASFSKFHFIRLFKQSYGKTPNQYLMSVRIEQARLLLNTGMAVNEACYAVGFDSISSFSALFKKITRSSPAAYRQQQIERNAEMKRVPLKYVPNCFAEQNGWT
jgi:AraC-like DNA-binding protein